MCDIAKVEEGKSHHKTTLLSYTSIQFAVVDTCFTVEDVIDVWPLSYSYSK